VKSYLIYNPVAGKLQRDPSLIPRVHQALQAGAPVELLPTSGPGDATTLGRRCADEKARRVYVAGGDGTINEVINGLVGSTVELCPLPGGTANCLAVETGIGTNLVRAAQRASAFTAKRISLGHCRRPDGAERFFVAMAGAGVDAQIVRDVNSEVKKKFGKGAYWLAGFGSFFNRLPELFVESQGKKAQVSFALASRVRNYGGDLEIAKSVRLDEPYFETVLFEGKFALGYGLYLLGVLTNTHRGMRGVHVDKTQQLSLSAVNGHAIYLQLDGEFFGELPAELSIREDALTLAAPWTS
jgi:diacylglycerol kinase (ATP)